MIKSSMKLLTKLIAVLLLLLSYMACNRMPDTLQPAPCPDDLACTEEYRSIVVTILSEDGLPIALDRFTVTEGDLELSLETNIGTDRGWHTIFSDAFQKTYQNREVTLKLKGYLGDKMVVNQDYVVGADCCHIYNVSGPAEIRLP